MREWRAASAAPLLRVNQLAIDGWRVRVLLTVLATLVFTVHSVAAHVGHGEDGSPFPTDQSTPSHFDAYGAATEPATEFAQVYADSTSGEAQVEDAHDDPTCGETAPRHSVPTGVVCPVLRVLWQLEPLASTYSPPTGPAPPHHRAPRLVHELGVQRV